MNLPPLRDPFFTYRYRRRLHVLRVMLALTASFLLTHFLTIPHSGWALVSTVMVMGNLPHIGGVLDKGRQRLLGTLLGAASGLLLILLPGDLTPLIPAGSLTAIGVATWLTFGNRHGYSGLMFAISLLLVAGDGNHALDVGLWRAFNVLLGTLVGITTTMLILPQKATDLLRFMLAENLDRLARLFHAHTTATAALDIDTQALLKATSSALVKQRGLVDAIHRERRLSRNELDDVISLQRRMLSTIELLLETHWNTRAGHDRIEAMEGLRDEQHRLSRELGTLAYQVRTGQSIDVEISQFDLQRHAPLATTAVSPEGRALFSPSGYLWLNRELARLTEALVTRLGGLTRLPSQRLRRASGRKWARRHTATPDRGAQDAPRQP
ncbi:MULTISPECIES: FUSC family protein [Halomonas]|uniref:FUSC family protein n=2 Tax=Halomonas TaxID=2745 RepID=A0A7X4VXT8_9GAMM|nr:MULTISPECIES: FUSC family protein [Halomonas]MDR5902195.1 FUSC family protein [Halomonas icarae]NAW12005.1 FUSC family protein [Halomonas icarae]TDB05689.1 FUSC family protein [Halomonas marinisediminis]